MKPDLFRRIEITTQTDSEREAEQMFVDLVIEKTAERRGLRRDQVRASLLAKLDVDDQQQQISKGLSHTVPMGVH